MPLRIALFASKVSPISKLIEWETRSKYSHAAIVQSDGSVIESVEGVGVHRLSRLPDVTPPDRIDLFEVRGPYGALTDGQIGHVEAFLGQQLGLPYDWPDLLGFITRDGNNEARGAWFCSELVFAAIEAGGVTLLRDIPPFQVSPGTLSLSPYLIPCSQPP
jgi:uncharacterized protein YycO